MAREFAIVLYLFVFKVVFNLFKPFSLRDKVTFVVSFGQNNIFILDEIVRQNIPYEVVFLRKSSCPYDFKDYPNVSVVDFETSNIINQVKSIYHLATSKFVVIDNYYAFLSAIQFKKDVQCIQIWHAAGALKTFGLKDQSINHRSKRAYNRFLDVYNQFHKVIVGSDALANIFMEAFNLPQENILRTGIPRTDLFYNYELQKELRVQFYRENKDLKDKKVILYAPTYRDTQLTEFDVQLDLAQMYQHLGDDFVVIIKLHPAIRGRANFDQMYPNFVFDYSSYHDINELLIITDYLITDYSSIPYEFSLLGKPMIFFPYDLEEYKSDRGIWSDYEKLVPGPVLFNTTDIIDNLKKNNFDLDRIRAFSKVWNQYSNGHSSQNFVEFLHKEENYYRLHG